MDRAITNLSPSKWLTNHGSKWIKWPVVVGKQTWCCVILTDAFQKKTQYFDISMYIYMHILYSIFHLFYPTKFLSQYCGHQKYFPSTPSHISERFPRQLAAISDPHAGWQCFAKKLVIPSWIQTPNQLGQTSISFHLSLSLSISVDVKALIIPRTVAVIGLIWLALVADLSWFIIPVPQNSSLAKLTNLRLEDFRAEGLICPKHAQGQTSQSQWPAGRSGKQMQSGILSWAGNHGHGRRTNMVEKYLAWRLRLAFPAWEVPGIFYNQSFLLIRSGQGMQKNFLKIKTTTRLPRLVRSQEKLGINVSRSR